MWPLAEFRSSGPVDTQERTWHGTPQGESRAEFERGYWTVPSLWLWTAGDRSRGAWWCTEAWVWHLGCLSWPQTLTTWHLTGWKLKLQTLEVKTRLTVRMKGFADQLNDFLDALKSRPASPRSRPSPLLGVHGPLNKSGCWGGWTHQLESFDETVCINQQCEACDRPRRDRG